MPKILSQNHYRRRAWMAQLFESHQGHDVAPHELKRWLPENLIFMKDALELWGKEKIPEWTGLERNARKFSEPPDAPWLWRSYEPSLDGPDTETNFFMFDESNQKISVSEEQANDWWNEIQPTIIAEWKSENAANQRWLECLNSFREHLSRKSLIGIIFDDKGEFYTIQSGVWLSVEADEIFKSGIANLPVLKNGILEKVKGPVVFTKDFMNPKKKPEQQKDSEKQETASDIEKFPYIKFMLKAINELPFESEGRTPKKIIEAWLREHWPDNLGKATDTKVSNMATFLRRPEDEGGGNHGKATDS